MHEDAEAQETSSSELVAGWPLPGLGTMDHLAPFHDSIKVLFPLPACPAAVHTAAETHDTPVRPFNAPCPLGLGTMDHWVPSQDSIKVTSRLCVGEPTSAPPTAVQAVGEVHDTLSSSSVMLAGLGLGTTDQAEPFQDSVNVTSPPPAPWMPTAMQASAETQETSCRKLLLLATPALGVSTIDQVSVAALAGAKA